MEVPTTVDAITTTELTRHSPLARAGFTSTTPIYTTTSTDTETEVYNTNDTNTTDIGSRSDSTSPSGVTEGVNIDHQGSEDTNVTIAAVTATLGLVLLAVLLVVVIVCRRKSNNRRNNKERSTTGDIPRSHPSDGTAPDGSALNKCVANDDVQCVATDDAYYSNIQVAADDTYYSNIQVGDSNSKIEKNGDSDNTISDTSTNNESGELTVEYSGLIRNNGQATGEGTYQSLYP
ncbi:hypothetical protein ScPMuIL_012298 [Solemya velum]